jgi:hypothetical protein
MVGGGGPLPGGLRGAAAVRLEGPAVAAAGAGKGRAAAAADADSHGMSGPAARQPAAGRDPAVGGMDRRRRRGTAAAPGRAGSPGGPMMAWWTGANGTRLLLTLI